ncbi:hypothetical protein [Actinokineospora pegani]|uniref:hypothetical protein n=1 Tax=Actinokineospora pegani TaxID=2654637 RepID=UPI0012EA5077|nr:hypothetical protein [Actinokineospora pegani]
MDERELSDMFDAAVPAAPPASFGADDVVAESNRLTRKRNRVLAGSALGVVLLAGASVVGVSVWSTTQSNDNTVSVATLPGNGNQENGSGPVPEQPGGNSGPRILEGTRNSPTGTPLQGGEPSGDAGADAGGTPGGCGTADRELANALAGGLPAATSAAGSAVRSPLTCPSGARSAAVVAQNGPSRGLLSIMLVPAGAAQVQQPPWDSRPDGTTGIVLKTASGASLVLAEEGMDGSAGPPLDDTALRELAQKLAAGL